LWKKQRFARFLARECALRVGRVRSFGDEHRMTPPSGEPVIRERSGREEGENHGHWGERRVGKVPGHRGFTESALVGNVRLQNPAYRPTYRTHPL
jgi:hypothetical protein